MSSEEIRFFGIIFIWIAGMWPATVYSVKEDFDDGLLTFVVMLWPLFILGTVISWEVSAIIFLYDRVFFLQAFWELAAYLGKFLNPIYWGKRLR